MTNKRPVVAAAEQNPSNSPGPAAADPGKGQEGLVEARLPQAVLREKSRPRAAARPEPRPGERYNPGDLICGQCGTGNAPSRRFCRRCGASLVEAAVVATPWWRRIFPARIASRAGTRPDAIRRTVDGSRFASGAKLLAKTLIALILIGAVAVLAASPDTRTRLTNRAVAAVKDVRRAYFVGEFVQVRPEGAQASSEVIGHPAQFLVDPNAGYWAADTAQDAQPVATLNFAQATDLDYVVVTSGAGQDFAKMGRPRQLRVTYLPAGVSEKVNLSDDPKPLRYHLHGRQASAVRLQIVAVYPTAQSSLVAISELSFFKLK
jgi:hypothetical protein